MVSRHRRFDTGAGDSVPLMPWIQAGFVWPVREQRIEAVGEIETPELRLGLHPLLIRQAREWPR